MDRNESAPAIVIQSEKRGDYDRILTLLSPVWGIRRVIVYGARKSQKAVKASLYTEATFVIYSNPERHNCTLVDITPISVHSSILTSLETSFSASLMSELALIEKGEEREELYDLYTSFLDILDENNWRRVLIQYIVRYLSLVGLFDDLEYCPVCLRPYGEKDILGFSSSLGVPCCPNCDSMSSELILPPNARAYLRESLRTEKERAMGFIISENMEARLLRYLTRTLSYSLPVPLKCLKSGLLNSLQ
ncbi:MAG: DNA repair protein RecO [Sphaerochaetaceae bacterium]|nr:DNA repair protein RecO [Sphaerochaetaceae bacterium]